MRILIPSFTYLCRLPSDRDFFVLMYTCVKKKKKEDKVMYGAILGDMIGAPYEFDMGDKTKEFPLFC